MPTLEAIIKKKVERLETVPDNLAISVKKAQKDIYNEILDLLGKLERKEGMITMSKSNLLLIDEITLKTRKVVLGSDYVDSVQSFVNEFDSQAKINDSFFKKMDVTITEEALTNQMVISAKKNSAELLLGTPMDAQFLQPIKTLLDDAVSSGASWSKTVANIQTFVIGNEEVDGRLLRYSKQIASDSFATADRAYTNVVADDAGFEWYLYTGGIIQDTREFCAQRNNNYYHYKEVEKWGTLNDWSGRMPNTDSQTIFITCGGFNCKHSLIPTSVFAVPIADVKRNISNGNYNPSEEVAKELGL